MVKTRCAMLLLSCLCSPQSVVFAQGVPIVSDSAPTLSLNVRASRLPGDKRYLSPQINEDKIVESAPRSIGWIFGWNAAFVADHMLLDDHAHAYLAKCFKDRKEALDSNLSEAVSKLNEATTATEFREVCADFAKNELRAENKFIEKLDELFSPPRMRELMMLVIETDQYQFGKVGVIRDAMKLTSDQVDQFSKLGKSFLHELLVHKQKSGEVKFDSKLAANAAERIVSVRNSLNKEQFEFYAAAIGLIPKDIPLEKHLLACPKQEKEKLMMYKVCRELKPES